MIDFDLMRSIALNYFANLIEEKYGSNGMRALKELLNALKAVHRQVAYELITGGLTVFSSLELDSEFEDLGPGAKISAADLPARFRGTATLQVMSGGDLRFWPQSIQDHRALSEVAVVYHYNNGDFFVVDGSLHPVPNPTGFPSAFGLPTFVDLDRALNYYANAMARRSTCKILCEAWWDDRRVFLVNRPEHIMRESLTQFLRCTLRDHELVEIREEQNVDESHPVDIKISWSMSNRIAIIEVKWLGYSVHASEPRVSTSYDEARAREGAEQLAGYLEANGERVPMHITRGYLVVFDARREEINPQNLTKEIKWEAADYYANREIIYDPRYENLRSDFAPPVRFFLQARQQDVA
jgi:hypothetical protein